MDNKSVLNSFFAKRILKDRYTEEKGTFLEALLQSSREGHLCLEDPNAPDFSDFIAIQRHQNRTYIQRNWAIETHILEQIQRLKNSPCDYPPFDLDSLSLLPAQKRAVKAAFEQRFSIICGGPGTGKTYTAATFVRLFMSHQNKAKIILAAPTGKAASHLQSVLGLDIEATTLHRLLKIRPGEVNLSTNWKIDADLVIVDEASMLDALLLAKLLESIGQGTRLVLLGDPDQLPPVEAGSVFRELAIHFGVRLECSMRTANAEIHRIAEAVNRGEWIGKCLPWEFDSELVSKLYQKIDPKFSWEEPEAALKKLNQFRILGALRAGPFGIDAINQKILQAMNGRIRSGEWWTVPIMITSNRCDQDLYNGHCGVLIGKSRGGIHLKEGTAYFPKKVPFKMLPPFEIAFCLSVHKSQGSEFERVLALFPEGSEHFGKEAVYTAITRAKKEVEIVAQENVLKAMLTKHSIKTSGLSDRLRQTGL